ncbi:MAG: hypothetical protein II750_00605 [Bacteroidaceae bacterium]|nr:hypothetical protein [Bacteroidaceae bacterium]
MKQLLMLGLTLALSMSMSAQRGGGGFGGGGFGGFGGGGFGGFGGGNTNMARRATESKVESFQDQATQLAKKFKIKKANRDMFTVLYLNWQTDRFNAVNPTGGDQESEESQIDFENMTDSEADAIVEQSIGRQIKQIEVDRKYYQEFKSMVTTQQAAQIFLQERNTAYSMFNMMRNFDFSSFSGGDFDGGGFGGGGFGGGGFGGGGFGGGGFGGF